VKSTGNESTDSPTCKRVWPVWELSYNTSQMPAIVKQRTVHYKRCTKTVYFRITAVWELPCGMWNNENTEETHKNGSLNHCQLTFLGKEELQHLNSSSMSTRQFEVWSEMCQYFILWPTNSSNIHLFFACYLTTYTKRYVSKGTMQQLDLSILWRSLQGIKDQYPCTTKTCLSPCHVWWVYWYIIYNYNTCVNP